MTAPDTDTDTDNLRRAIDAVKSERFKATRNQDVGWCLPNPRAPKRSDGGPTYYARPFYRTPHAIGVYLEQLTESTWAEVLFSLTAPSLGRMMYPPPPSIVTENLYLVTWRGRMVNLMVDEQYVAATFVAHGYGDTPMKEHVLPWL